MLANQTLSKSNWFTKFSISFLAITGATNLFLYLIMPLLPFKLSKFILPFGLSLMVLAIVFSLFFSIYWHIKENKQKIDSAKYHIWLTTLLRYWIAFQISSFGIEKIMGINFAPSLSSNDTPAGLLNGQQLTWIYYSYSYGISLVIAFFQIFGSYLLLFRKTILLGICLLLPVMFNILLINIFYGIGVITTFMAAIVVLGLSYLLYQRKEEILQLFTNFNSAIPSIIPPKLTLIARIACVIIPIVFLYTYRNKVFTSSKYFGKWEVASMLRNGKKIPKDAWEKDSLAWKTIYFEERGKVFFTPNPYLYEDEKSILMKYDYVMDKDALQVICNEKDPNKPDTIPVKITNFKKDAMQWQMVLYNDTIQMHLQKESK